MKTIILNDQILIRTFKEMENQFSSKEFCKLARFYGYAQSNVERGYVNVFLSHHCDHISKFMRLKKSEITEHKNDLFHEGELKEKEIESIKFLKSRGFKIMKREFIEI
tara:strand:+ start:2471 stop:2794 length:324 start_codon:yes stop_codon:yes gene_type:complete